MKENETQAALPSKLRSHQGFYDFLLSKGYSYLSSESYIRDAQNFINWCKNENLPVEQVNYSDILHYLQSIKQRVQQRTASVYINSIKHYFRYLKASNEIIENPVNQVQIKGIKRRKLYHILTKAELESLYHHFEVPSKESEHKNQNWYQLSVLAAKRNKVILGLLVYQGLNTNELNNLDKKDVKLREGTICIRGTRRSNERIMRLEAFQIMDLMEYILKSRAELLELSGKESEKLFISSGSGAKLQNTIQKLMEKLRSQNKEIDNAKQIRASVITNWLKLHNLRQVQYMAGHRFVSSTEQYLINNLDDLQEDINKYHPIG
ncbi:MAG: tyrosine-type recombinase/integrase [Proteobacteria bacterium]|nr:tyrosine-type recombinase/integrase [Pseudomonadota bacterium]